MWSGNISRIPIVWSSLLTFSSNMSSIMKWTGTWSYCIGSLIKHRPLEEHSSHFFTPVLPAFRKSSAVLHGHLYIFHLQIWSSSNDVNTHILLVVLVAMASDSRRSWWAPAVSSQYRSQGAISRTDMKHRAEIPEAPHTHSLTHAVRHRLHVLILQS